MTPERSKRIHQIFNEAMKRKPAQRMAWLREACGQDAGLLREVENLLREAAVTETQAFLETEAVVAAAPALPRFDQDRSLTGRRIGLYRIVRELGRGGMGAVYLAE